MCVTVSELNMVILYFYFLFSLSVIYCTLLTNSLPWSDITCAGAPWRQYVL